MNTAAIKRLLILLSSSGKVEQAQLYQLLQWAERCYCLKDLEGQRDVGRVLQSLPSPYQEIGNYYEGVYLIGQGDYKQSETLLEHVADYGPERYRARALLTLGGSKEFQGRYDEALRLRIESTKLTDAFTFLQAQLGIAVYESLQGNHKAAIARLEKYMPLTHSFPTVFLDCMNSYALELCEVGRIEEAYQVIKQVLASPFSAHYPNWLDTGKQIYRKSYRSSMVSIPKIIFESAEPEAGQEQETQTGSVISFPALKEAPQPQKPERVKSQEISDMSTAEKREIILAAIRTGTIPGSEYTKMMYMLGLVESGPADKVLDLEDDALLDDIAVVWANHVGPERFAAVLSALRDCEDRLRRNDIIDRMIKIAFGQTHLHGVTEEAWRLEVERRLPKK